MQDATNTIRLSGSSPARFAFVLATLHAAMIGPAIALVDLPRSLRNGIDRRLPRGWIRNQTSKRFGSKSVVGFAGFIGPFAAWLCRCKCGRLVVIRGAKLSGCHTDCHCRQSLSPAAKQVYNTYQSIVKRCYDPTNISYAAYGAIGVTVCKRWRESVEAFAKDMGPRPSSKHVITRRNPRGNYTPANCFWATRSDVRRRNGRMIRHNGRRQNLSAWAAELGISYEAMRMRVNRCIERGLNLSLAINTPPKRSRPRASAR
jgi:hypothetical protein